MYGGGGKEVFVFTGDGDEVKDFQANYDTAQGFTVKGVNNYDAGDHWVVTGVKGILYAQGANFTHQDHITLSHNVDMPDAIATGSWARQVEWIEEHIL